MSREIGEYEYISVGDMMRVCIERKVNTVRIEKIMTVRNLVRIL